MTTQLVITFHDYGDHWEALINDGWWVGRGDTMDKARESVIRRFNSEHQRFTGKTYEFTDASQPVQLGLFDD